MTGLKAQGKLASKYIVTAMSQNAPWKTLVWHHIQMVMHVAGIKEWFVLCHTIIGANTFRIPMSGSLKQVCEAWKLVFKELHCDSDDPRSVRGLAYMPFQKLTLKTR